MIDTQHPVQYFFHKAYENLEYVLIPIVLFFTPIGGILIAVAGIILLDTLTGVWKSVKTRGWASITSRGMSALISKLLLYQSTILVTFLVDNFILGEVLIAIFSIEMLLTKAVAMVLISIEVSSINENYKAVRNISLWEALKNLISRAKEIQEEVKDFKK